MKSFLLSSTLFLLLVVYIITNTIYISGESQALVEMSEALQDTSAPDFITKLQALEERWSEFKKTVRTSCADSELNNVDMVIEELRAAHNASDYGNCSVLVAKLTAKLRNLDRLEKYYRISRSKQR